MQLIPLLLSALRVLWALRALICDSQVLLGFVAWVTSLVFGWVRHVLVTYGELVTNISMGAW